MSRTISIVIIASFIIFFQACKNNQTDQQTTKPEAEIWTSIFNGKDLDGWDIKIAGYPLGENYNNTFRVENGELVSSCEEYEKFNGQFGHIFYRTPYSKYRLRLQYRFGPDQCEGGAGWAYKNNGIMFHSQSAKSMGLDQGFPVCLEYQFLGGRDDGDRPSGCLCTPGTNVLVADTLNTDHCIGNGAKTYHTDDWLTAELYVYEDSIAHHIIEGDTVFTYSKFRIGGGHLPDDYPLAEGTPVKEGYIALQAESHPTYFRNIEIQEID